MANFQDRVTESVPEEGQTENLLDKDFTSSILNMLYELKEIMKKS